MTGLDPALGELSERANESMGVHSGPTTDTASSSPAISTMGWREHRSAGAVELPLEAGALLTPARIGLLASVMVSIPFIWPDRTDPNVIRESAQWSLVLLLVAGASCAYSLAAVWLCAPLVLFTDNDTIPTPRLVRTQVVAPSDGAPLRYTGVVRARTRAHERVPDGSDLLPRARR